MTSFKLCILRLYYQISTFLCVYPHTHGCWMCAASTGKIPVLAAKPPLFQKQNYDLTFCINHLAYLGQKNHRFQVHEVFHRNEQFYMDIVFYTRSLESDLEPLNFGLNVLQKIQMKKKSLETIMRNLVSFFFFFFCQKHTRTSKIPMLPAIYIIPSIVLQIC